MNPTNELAGCGVLVAGVLVALAVVLVTIFGMPSCSGSGATDGVTDGVEAPAPVTTVPTMGGPTSGGGVAYVPPPDGTLLPIPGDPDRGEFMRVIPQEDLQFVVRSAPPDHWMWWVGRNLWWMLIFLGAAAYVLNLAASGFKSWGAGGTFTWVVVGLIVGFASHYVDLGMRVMSLLTTFDTETYRSYEAPVYVGAAKIGYANNTAYPGPAQGAVDVSNARFDPRYQWLVGDCGSTSLTNPRMDAVELTLKAAPFYGGARTHYANLYVGQMVEFAPSDDRYWQVGLQAHGRMAVADTHLFFGPVGDLVRMNEGRGPCAGWAGEHYVNAVLSCAHDGWSDLQRTVDVPSHHGSGGHTLTCGHLRRCAEQQMPLGDRRRGRCGAPHTEGAIGGQLVSPLSFQY